jgi:hypothetical protein
VIIQAGDLGIEIDLGSDIPGSVPQRYENGKWRDYLVDGEPVYWPFDLESLPSGKYRVAE